jgi:hypothetical protein
MTAEFDSASRATQEYVENILSKAPPLTNNGTSSPNCSGLFATVVVNDEYQ